MIFLLLAFLLGSIPFGILVARAFHVSDPRTQGSGNIGATNVARVAGLWPAGVLAFGLDLLKGAIPVFLASWPSVWAPIEKAPWLLDGLSAGDGPAWAAGFLAVLGHCYCPWLRFKGGKGVATGFGALLVLAPIPALIGLGIFGLMFFRTRIVSISCISGLIAAVVGVVSLKTLEPWHVFGAIMIFVILIRHEANLDALLEGRERTFRKA